MEEKRIKRIKDASSKFCVDYHEMAVDSVAAINKLRKRIIREGGFTYRIYKELSEVVQSTSNIVLIDWYNWTIKPLVNDGGNRMNKHLSCVKSSINVTRYASMPTYDKQCILNIKKRVLDKGNFRKNDYDVLYRKVCKYNPELIVFFKCALKDFIDYKLGEVPSARFDVKYESIPGNKFQIENGCIRLDEYVLRTVQAIAVPDNLMMEVIGTYSVRKKSDGTFSMRQGDLPRLLENAEKACYDCIERQISGWVEEVRKQLKLHINEKEYKETWMVDIDRIQGMGDYKYTIHNKPCILIDHSLKYKLNETYRNLVNTCNRVPQTFKDAYLKKYPKLLLIGKIESAFTRELYRLIKENINYSKDDDEIFGKKQQRKSIFVNVTNNTLEYVGVIDCHQIELSLIDSVISLCILPERPYGKIYHFSQGSIQLIEQCLSKFSIPYGETLKKVLKSRLDYIKGEQQTNSSLVDNVYPYDNGCPLYNIKNKRYAHNHKKCQNLFYDYVMNGCKHILYFWDPNMFYSHYESKPVSCYILQIGNYIRLYSLDYSKSTYVFVVRQGMEGVALFFIWSYFSSYIYNKREGMPLCIKSAYEVFGIVGFRREEPVSKDELGYYIFNTYPEKFYV